MLMVRKIVLSIAAVLMFVGFAAAQNKQITGTVTGPDGNPVAGASVAVDGTSLGTTTDVRGGFTLSAPANGTLIVSFIGYNDEHVAINGKTVLDIKMKESTHDVGDVIVVAFGEAKREAFTGSAAVLKSDDITKSQTTNAVDALNGKVAGVQIINASGQPGTASPTVLIRGISSIEAGKEPLIVVDGMSFAGGLNDINPSDIESMSVLKDAAAAALYGARGANGVILINTKRAKSRDAIVNVDIKVGVNQRAKQDYDYITNPGQHYETHYAMLRNYYHNERGMSSFEAHQRANQLLTSSNSGGLAYNVFNVPDGQTLIGLNGKLNPNATLGRKVRYDGEDYLVTPDDWTDEIYGNGVRQEYNVNIAGSNEKSNFFGSFGYLNNEGIVKKTGYERYTARLRADYQVKKWLKVGGNASYAHSYSQMASGEGESLSSGNIFSFVSRIAPIYPLYVRDADGNIRRDSFGNIIYDYGTKEGAGSNAGLERPFQQNSNAYGQHILDKYSSTQNMAAFNGFANINLPAGFKFTFNGGVSVKQYDTLSTGNMLYGASASNGGDITRRSGMSFDYTLQEILTWTRLFGKHNIDVMIGHENNYSMSRYIQGHKTGLYSQGSVEFSQALKVTSATSSFLDYNNEGYFFRAQYDYDGRIFVSGSYRRDASSRFHPDSRWGNFWSVSAGWLINRESWFNASWVDELKVKASFGSQGNDQIGDFMYMDRYTISNSEDKWAIRFAAKGTKDITWETNTNFNTGVEFGFFGNRLSGSVEYFHRKTTDMLSWFTVPSSMGYSGYYKNVGDMVNQGLELNLTGVILDKKHVSWDINLNLAYVKNRIAKLDAATKTGTCYTLDGKAYDGYFDGMNYYGEGLPIYTMYLKAYAGVDQETGKPLFYHRNDDGSLSTTTDYANGASYFLFDTALPDVNGGFGTTLRFYGFDLSVNFVYQIGGKVYDGDYASAMSSPVGNSGIGDAFHKDILKSWTPQNPNNEIPRFQYNTQYTGSTSDRFLTDASYLSLQNINFGYTLPSKWMSKIGVSKLRIYLSCENVWLWSQRKGLDPRQSYTGGASNEYYSPIRTISGGISLTF